MSNSRHRALFVSIALGVAIILRVYPTLLHGAPWGTDGWPLFKDAQQLLSNTPTILGGNPRVFADQYNIYWPGSIVFGAVSSLVFDFVPVEIMPVLFPVVAALSTLFLFTVVEKFTGSAIIAFISSLFFTISSFDSIFTASVTKETFAYPILILGILLLLLAIGSKKLSYRILVLFVVVSFSLILAHYAIAVLFAAIVGSVLIGQYVVSLSRSLPHEFDFRLLLLPVSLFVAISLYLLYAWPGFEIPVNLSSVLSVTSFLILSVAVSLYFTLAKKIPIMLPAMILVVAIAILSISTLIPIVPFEPLITSSLLFDAIPYLLVGLFALTGYEIAHRSFPKDQFSFLATWMAIPLALFGFSVFGTPNGIYFIYRLFTFIYVPAAILAGIFLGSLIEKRAGNRIIRAKQIIAILLVFAVVVMCAYQSYAAVFEGQNLLGGQWGYTPSDVSSATWTKALLIANASISGDSKIMYLYGDFYGVNVDIGQGYLDLSQGITNLSSSPLVADKIMALDGYNIALYGNPLPLNWHGNLANHTSLIYNNGNEEIWY